jgi:hypothetical protein
MPMMLARAFAFAPVLGPVLAPALAPALAAAIAAGCGSSGSGAGPSTAAPSAIATPALTADDAPVAHVNGRTVWASCVAAQARTVAAGGDAERRAAALDQCIAFELLAQAAEARGLAAAPEVGQAVRDAEVNRLVETEFEQRYRRPADLAPQLDAVLTGNPWLLRNPELRDSTYARFVVPKDAPAEVEARAHALADRLAAELADQTGLFGVHLSDAARRIAQGSGAQLETTDFRPARRDQLVDEYAAALFAVPEVGRASRAFRTPWGWDVVVWTGGTPARERSRDEVAAEVFPELRRRQFQRWVTQLARERGVHIELEQAELSRLDTEAGPEGGTGGGP